MDTVTVGDAAILLDVSTETVRRLIDSGTLPAVRFTDISWRRIEKKHLEEFARSRGVTLDWSKLDNRE